IIAGRARAAAPRHAWTAGDRLRLLAAGALGVALYNLALNTGEQSVNAGTASLLVSASPVFAAVLAVLFLGARPGRVRLAAMALGLGGVGVVAFGTADGVRLDPGCLPVLVAALAQGAFFALQKPLLARHPARVVASGAAWWGALFLVPFAPQLARAMAHAPAT